MQNDVVPSRRRVRAGTQGIPIAELSVESFTAPITAYMRSYFLTARAAVRRMVEKRSGVMLVHTPEREDAYAGVERWSEAFNSGDCLRQGTRVAFDAMVSAFPPALSPRRVTIVTKFFCTDTEPQHGPHMFGSGWRRVLTWDRSPGTLRTRRSHYGHQDDRRAHHRERFAVDRDKFSVVAPTDERYRIGAR